VAETGAVAEEAGQDKRLGSDVAEHHFGRHGQGGYGRGDIHTNTIEGYSSIIKRGMKGVTTAVPRSTCIGSSRSSTSATTTGPSSVLVMPIGTHMRWPVLLVSGSNTAYLHESN